MAIGDVQNVLLAMQKNLECAICLDVVKEPVSTKCDHVFCRLCIFRLFSEKKKGVVECPLCKTEVAKRSLKENSRFKQLIEVLLETIHAFELDTGVKILNSHHLPKTSTEGTAADLLCEEHSVIQSRGFRNRKKSTKGNGQETCTLQEANVDRQLADTRVKQRPLRNKTKRCDSEKGIYIEFGSDSSEELFKQQSNASRSEDKTGLHISSQEQKGAEEGKGCCLNAQSDKLGAKGGILPNVPGESDFSKEGLSKRSTQSTTEYAKPVQVNVTGFQSSALNAPVDVLAEQCDRTSPDSASRSRDTSSSENTEAAHAEQTWCSSKRKELDLKGSSESMLDESKDIDTVEQIVEAVETHKPENGSLRENTLEKLLQPETLHCTALVEVSRKRLKRSVEKVNEWFSKSKEILTSNSPQGDSAGAAVSDDDDVSLSDKDSCISEKTDPMEITVDEGNRGSRPMAESIKDKIFGKTYKRERKSNPPVIWRDVLPSTKQEDVGAAEKCLNDSSRERLKRKRKTAHVLQPEDFIKQKDREETGGSPQSVNCCFGDAEKKKCDESSAVNESHLSENREDNTLAALEEGGGSIQKKATAKVAGKQRDSELELKNCDQKSTKKNTAAKRCRSSTRAMCALQLVVDRNSPSPDPAEPQIDSYPSSEEARKVDSEQRQVRRSRRLQLLSREMTKEMGKGAVIKRARTSGSDGEEPFGDQSNVLVHTSECKDLGESQGVLSHNLLTDPKADKMLVSPQNSPDTAETGMSLFNPPALCQHSDCSSSAPEASSHGGEIQGNQIQGNPLLQQSPSMTVVQTPDPAEEVAESCVPQDSGHDMQSVPGDFRTEKLPVARKAWDLIKEAADSELDTQSLRGIFRRSKRLSFSLYPAPTELSAAEGAAAEPLKVPCAAQVENEQSKHLNTENLQEEKTAESLSRVSEKEELKTYESACVSPVTCSLGNTECMDTVEHEAGVSQVANQETLTPVRVDAARIEDKNRLQKGEQGDERTVSAAVGIGGELRQSPVSTSRQSDQSSTAELTFRTGVNTVNEICFGSGSNQAQKAEAVDSKGPVLHSQSRSMISAAPEQKPAEFRGEVIEKKRSKRGKKQVKGNEEETTQTGGTAMPKCLVPEAPEEPLKGNGGFIDMSESTAGLLCSDVDTEENSFAETDRREQSAVFVKKSDHALTRDLQKRNAGSRPRSGGIQRSRRRVMKLPSSDEESSEDEDLPCFQTLIFGKSVSTPLQVSKQVASVVESSLSPITSPHDGSHDDSNMKKVPEAAPSNECLSLSQESESSINLFSSQSNNSEESADGAKEPKELLAQADRLKQVKNVSESKETSQSCSGRLKRSKTNFKDECQEDPNVGANLASGYDSETSNVEDSCGPFSQGEILTTQQKKAMQNNLKKLQQEMAVLEAVLQQHGSQDSEFSPVHRELPHSSSKGTLGVEQRTREKKNADEQKSGTRLNSPPALSNLPGNASRSPSNSPCSVEPLQPGTAEGAESSAAAQAAKQSCAQEGESKSSVVCPLPVLHSVTGRESAAVTNRKAMSIVASGLEQSERLVVQRFARKTWSTLSNHITEGTTHVIMKTDEELVCERTLKYFLGIAGRKWVVSYQWVIQSFKEGRILDEENFEVRGDVINGRNHQGPKRARESLTEKIFKGFEICCCGPFTGMTTENLEWMVELCGASVVKQLHLFTHTTSSAVVVVQPDAWMENMDYRAIQQKNNVAMVTREWVLDSVACYECQELDAYLVS